MSLITEKQAAEKLGLASSTLKRWRWSGRGPAYIKLGASVRYSPEILDSYANSRAVGGENQC